jgi:ribosome biogenesis GTPase A
MEAKKARQGDYIREYGEIPECAEKLIFKLILYLQGCTSIVGEIIFVDTIEKLKKSLENEELDSTRNLELVEQAKDLAQVTSNESIKSLEELLGNIRDIDIQRLIGLVEKNNLAIETIRDKNIYFFMGLTGHGKSTTIHYLAGSRFEKYTENGEVRLFAGARPYFKPDPPASAKNLQYVTTSPYPESDTHSIIPVVINLKSGGEAILCDSPGFEDTCVELDIANSLMIENAIQQCSGVKPIVVISKNMGERMKG